MRIGIFGGSFDPVHEGHIALAKSALESKAVDKVVFVPAAHQPFKPDQRPASGEDRIKMLERAISGIPGLEVSDYELSRPDKISYTIDTLLAMREKYGDENEVCFILGADSFIKVHTWKRADLLISSFPLIVGVRPGYDDSEIIKQKAFLEKELGARVTLLNNPHVDISSTEIRAYASSIAGGNSREKPEKPDELPGRIEEYIIEQGLYNK